MVNRAGFVHMSADLWRSDHQISRGSVTQNASCQEQNWRCLRRAALGRYAGQTAASSSAVEGRRGGRTIGRPFLSQNDVASKLRLQRAECGRTIWFDFKGNAILRFMSKAGF